MIKKKINKIVAFAVLASVLTCSVAFATQKGNTIYVDNKLIHYEAAGTTSGGYAKTEWQSGSAYFGCILRSRILAHYRSNDSYETLADTSDDVNAVAQGSRATAGDYTSRHYVNKYGNQIWNDNWWLPVD